MPITSVAGRYAASAAARPRRIAFSAPDDERRRREVLVERGGKAHEPAGLALEARVENSNARSAAPGNAVRRPRGQRWSAAAAIPLPEGVAPSWPALARWISLVVVGHEVEAARGPVLEAPTRMSPTRAQEKILLAKIALHQLDERLQQEA